MNKGLVIKSTGSYFEVKDEKGETITCKIKGNFRIKEIKSTNPIAVGDHVKFVVENNNQDKKKIGWITEVFDRKNYIIRRSTNLSKRSHIIAANIDQAVLVNTIVNPVTTTTFIDRYLASAAAYSIPVLIVFNKTDLYNTVETQSLNSILDTYRRIGYKCITTSAKSYEGIEDLISALKNKTNVINGHSGVGKSTLINIIQPGLNLKTDEISHFHKTGKHTTAFSEMFELSFGGYIIDTPGIKGFGMLDMEPWEISHYFTEIFEISKKCKYKNCSHTHEPGCAVKRAVEHGDIATTRYISYIGLLEEDEKYRKPY